MERNSIWQSIFGLFRAKPVLSALGILVLYYFNQNNIHAWFLGQGEYEVTIQKALLASPAERLSGGGSMAYTLTNIGHRPISVFVKAKHENASVQLEGYKLFGIHANAPSYNLLSIDLPSTLSNVSILRLEELPPGVGLRIQYLANRSPGDYWSSFSVNETYGENHLVEHSEVSPYGKITLRLFSLLTILLFLTHASGWIIGAIGAGVRVAFGE